MEGEWLLPTSTPVQFEPEALRASVQRLMSYEPQAMYLTHFGRIGLERMDVPRLAALLLAQVDEMVALGLRLRDASDRHQQLKAGLREIYLRRLQAHGCQLAPEQQAALLDMDIELNAQGLAVWLDKAKV